MNAKWHEQHAMPPRATLVVVPAASKRWLALAREAQANASVATLEASSPAEKARVTKLTARKKPRAQ